jgi:hypothetical protein
MVRKGVMIKADEAKPEMMVPMMDAPRAIGSGMYGGAMMPEMSAFIGLGKDGKKYYIDPSVFTTKERPPVPRTTQLSGMAKPMLGMTKKMLDGGALGVEGQIGRPMRGSNDTYGVDPMVEKATEKPLAGGSFWGGFMDSYADAMGEGRVTGGAMCGCEGEGLTGGMKKRGRPAKDKPVKADGRAKRAEIVKKVMRERGIKSLAEASKIVKAEGLY